MSFIMTFTILLGVTLAYDSFNKTDQAEQARIEERLKADQERQEALRELTVSLKTPRLFASDASRVYESEISYMIHATVRPKQRPLILTDYLFDDFTDGDYTSNPTWTMVSNGNGSGAEDWAIRTDPWSYAFGDVWNDSTGYMVGCDSDGGGALADEELSVSFNTPGGGGELTLYYWLYFRAYIGEDEYFEVLVDNNQVDFVQADSGYNPPSIIGDRIVILDSYNDGNPHTLTLHYYAYYGYACSVDDVVITDDPRTPCVVTCPPGAILEGEPDCYIEYDDVFNSGCNADTPPYPYSAIACGDTICGKSGVFRHSNPTPPPDSVTYRDTDWYRLVITEPSDVFVTGVAEFPFQLLFMDAGSEDCDDYETIASGNVGMCDTLELAYRVLPGVYWVWAGPFQWPAGLDCDGNGTYGNEYVIWVSCEATPPCQVNTNLGDINTAIPYADLGNTTCGAGHNYEGPSCLGTAPYNSGEDYVYEFTVSSAIVLDIVLDPDTTTWTSLVLDDFCPYNNPSNPNPADTGCLAISTSSLGQPHGFEQLLLLPGSYWIYVDKWSPTDCIENFNLYIVEGVQTVGLAETGNIPDCGVSNFGPLGEWDSQGNTYAWSGHDPFNFAGTFVMGNAPDRMFSYYNPGISDCYEYRGVTGLNMVDPFHPTSRYDDNDVLGGLSIEYCGHGYQTSPEDDIFVHSFKLTNNSGSAITDFYAGVYFDWDVGDADTIYFDWTNDVIIQAPILPAPDTVFYGLCLANEPDVGLNSMTAVSQQDHIYPSGPDSGGWRMDVLYGLMSAPGDSIADSMYTDMSSLLSSGPHTIADGDSITLNIAVIAGASLSDVQARAVTAAGLTIPDCNVAEPPPPTGRCCYESAGDTLCTENSEVECSTLGGYDWNQFLNCTDHPCVVAGCPYDVGDVNGSGNYNGLDITYGVAFFKGGNSPQCPQCPIPDCNTWNYCGDVNGSCNYNGLDITYGVAYFKGGAAPVPCIDCPPIE